MALSYKQIRKAAIAKHQRRGYKPCRHKRPPSWKFLGDQLASRVVDEVLGDYRD